MTPRCFQSLDNGQRCNAPAMQGSKFCRHHDPQNMALKEATPKSPEHTPLTLPELVDKPSMLAALNQVYIALGEGRIKRSVAHTLLSAIKLADLLVTEIAAAGETGIPVFSGAGKHAPESLRRNADSFSSAYSFPTHRYGADSDRDQLVRQLVAQSHELANHESRAAR